MVLLAAMGAEPDACWSTGLESVEAAGECALQIRIVESRSPTSCACLAVAVNSVHAVRLRRLDRRASFRFDRRILRSVCFSGLRNGSSPTS